MFASLTRLKNLATNFASVSFSVRLTLIIGIINLKNYQLWLVSTKTKLIKLTAGRHKVIRINQLLSTVKKKWANDNQTEATKTTNKTILVEINCILGICFSLETKSTIKVIKLTTVKKILKEVALDSNHQVANSKLTNNK